MLKYDLFMNHGKSKISRRSQEREARPTSKVWTLASSRIDSGSERKSQTPPNEIRNPQVNSNNSRKRVIEFQLQNQYMGKIKELLISVTDPREIASK
jgi:hypothetical protein